MAGLKEPANTQENSSTGGFDVIPEGDYVAMLTKNEWVNTKAGTGRFIYCEFKIVEGDHKGMVLIERLNLENPNDIAVKIGKQKANQMCAACLMDGVEDLDEIMGIPMKLTVSINENEDTDFPPQNEIKKFSNADDEEFVAPWE